MPAVSRISLRSAAPQRDGANEERASTELEATASRILLFRDLLGSGEYSALGRSPLSAAAASHPPLPAQQARTRPLPAVTIQTNDMVATPGTIPGRPAQERDRESAGEAVEGSYCNPSPPPRPSSATRHRRTGMAAGGLLKYATVSQEGRL